jgi:hypothetical protein
MAMRFSNANPRDPNGGFLPDFSLFSCDGGARCVGYPWERGLGTVDLNIWGGHATTAEGTEFVEIFPRRTVEFRQVC